MSQYAVEKFLGRILTDDHFREQASIDLVDALRTTSYNLSIAEVCALATLDLQGAICRRATVPSGLLPAD